jgi:hypothetical protein
MITELNKRPGPLNWLEEPLKNYTEREETRAKYSKHQDEKET